MVVQSYTILYMIPVYSLARNRNEVFVYSFTEYSLSTALKWEQVLNILLTHIT